MRTLAHLFALLLIAIQCNGPSGSPAGGTLSLGPAWHIVEVGATQEYSALWGSSPNDIIAVGPKDQMLRWNGAAWSSIQVSTGAMNSLFAVWGSSASDIWAGGDIVGGILHWNGTQWSKVSTPRAQGRGDFDQFAVLSIWGFSSSDAWAVGEFGKILHWTQSSWQVSPLSTDLAVESFHDVWGAAPNDVWAVGSHGTIIHWNGSGWSKIDSGVPTGTTLGAVWGTSGSDVWAAGASIVTHWDGVRWQRETLPSGSISFIEDLWGTSATDLWAVGSGIVHRTAAGWQSVRSPVPRLNAIWGGSASDAWAVGSRRFVRYSGV